MYVECSYFETEANQLTHFIRQLKFAEPSSLPQCTCMESEKTRKGGRLHKRSEAKGFTSVSFLSSVPSNCAVTKTSDEPLLPPQQHPQQLNQPELFGVGSAPSLTSWTVGWSTPSFATTSFARQIIKRTCKSAMKYCRTHKR
jgi:hypothetical protein